MQVQSLHLPPERRLSSYQQLSQLVTREGLKSLYRGLTPELLKVVRDALIGWPHLKILLSGEKEC